MVQTKRRFAKAFTLTASALMLAGSFMGDGLWHELGAVKGCGIVERLCYPAVHASPLHALVNVWCLISVVFIHDITMWRLLIAYITAAAVPDFALSSEMPTVGLSTMCYALLGSLSWEVRRKIYFQAWMAFYIGVGFLFPNVNAMIHVYGYAAGLMVGFLNAPVSCVKRSQR